ncbi:MAG: hypothetical protein R3C11_06220 [Planctomycetaceae bacterium]
MNTDEILNWGLKIIVSLGVSEKEGDREVNSRLILNIDGSDESKNEGNHLIIVQLSLVDRN